MVNKVKKLKMITFKRHFMIHTWFHTFILPQKEIFLNIFLLKRCRSIFCEHFFKRNPEVLLRPWPQDGPMTVKPLVSAGGFLEREKFEGKPAKMIRHMTYPPGNDHISHLGKRKIIFKIPFFWGCVSSLEGNMTVRYFQTPKFKPKLEESSKAHVGNGHANQKVCSITLLLFPDAKSCAENGSYLWSCVRHGTFIMNPRLSKGFPVHDLCYLSSLDRIKHRDWTLRGVLNRFPKKASTYIKQI